MDMGNVKAINLANNGEILLVKDGDGKTVWVAADVLADMTLEFLERWLGDYACSVFTVEAYYFSTGSFQYEFLTSGTLTLRAVSGLVLDDSWPTFEDASHQTGLTVEYDSNGPYVTYGGGGDEAYINASNPAGTYYSTGEIYDFITDTNVPQKKYVITCTAAALPIRISLTRYSNKWKLMREAL